MSNKDFSLKDIQSLYKKVYNLHFDEAYFQIALKKFHNANSQLIPKEVIPQLMEDVYRKSQLEQHFRWLFMSMSDTHRLLDILQTLQLFKLAFGNQLNPELWNYYLSTRKGTINEKVSFDEVKSWLIDPPYELLQPCSKEWFNKEEKKLCELMASEKDQTNSNKVCSTSHSDITQVNTQKYRAELKNYIHNKLSEHRSSGMNNGSKLGGERMKKLSNHEIYHLMDNKYKMIRLRVLMEMLKNESKSIFNVTTEEMVDKVFQKLETLRLTGGLTEQACLDLNKQFLSEAEFELEAVMGPVGQILQSFRNQYDSILSDLTNTDGASIQEINEELRDKLLQNYPGQSRYVDVVLTCAAREEEELRHVTELLGDADKTVSSCKYSLYCNYLKQIFDLESDDSLITTLVKVGLSERTQLFNREVLFYHPDRERQEYLADSLIYSADVISGTSDEDKFGAPPAVKSDVDRMTILKMFVEALCKKFDSERKLVAVVLNGPDSLLRLKSISATTGTNRSEWLKQLQVDYLEWRDLNYDLKKNLSDVAQQILSEGLYLRWISFCENNKYHEKCEKVQLLANLQDYHSEEFSLNVTACANNLVEDIVDQLYEVVLGVQIGNLDGVVAVVFDAMDDCTLLRQLIARKYNALRQQIIQSLCRENSQDPELSNDILVQEYRIRRDKKWNAITKLIKLFKDVQSLNVGKLMGPDKQEVKELREKCVDEDSPSDYMKYFKSSKSLQSSGNPLIDLTYRQNKEVLIFNIDEIDSRDDWVNKGILEHLWAVHQPSAQAACLFTGLLERVEDIETSLTASDASRLDSLVSVLQEALDDREWISRQSQLDSADWIQQNPLPGRKNRQSFWFHLHQKHFLEQCMITYLNAATDDQAANRSLIELRERQSQINQQRSRLDFNDSNDLDVNQDMLIELFILYSEFHRVRHPEDNSTHNLRRKLLKKLLKIQLLEIRDRLSTTWKKDESEMEKESNALSQMIKKEIQENLFVILVQPFRSKEESILFKKLNQKYDSLRDLLVRDLLLRQLGEYEWSQMSARQRSTQMLSLRIKCRLLEKDKKWNQLAHLWREASQKSNLLSDYEAKTRNQLRDRLKDLLQRRGHQNITEENADEDLESNLFKILYELRKEDDVYLTQQISAGDISLVNQLSKQLTNQNQFIDQSQLDFISNLEFLTEQVTPGSKIDQNSEQVQRIKSSLLQKHSNEENFLQNCFKTPFTDDFLSLYSRFKHDLRNLSEMVALEYETAPNQEDFVKKKFLELKSLQKEENEMTQGKLDTTVDSSELQLIESQMKDDVEDSHFTNIFKMFDLDLTKSMDDIYQTLMEKILMESLIHDGKHDWWSLSEQKKQKLLNQRRLEIVQLRKEGNYERIHKLLNQVKISHDTLQNGRKKQMEALRFRLANCGGKSESEVRREYEEGERAIQHDLLKSLRVCCLQDQKAILNKLKHFEDAHDRDMERQSELLRLRRERKLMIGERDSLTASLLIKMAADSDLERREDKLSGRNRQLSMARERITAMKSKSSGVEKSNSEFLIDLELPSDTKSVREKICDQIANLHSSEQAVFRQLILHLETADVQEEVNRLSQQSIHELQNQLRYLQDELKETDLFNKEEYDRLFRESFITRLVLDMKADSKSVDDVTSQFLASLEEFQMAQFNSVLQKIHSIDDLNQLHSVGQELQYTFHLGRSENLLNVLFPNEFCLINESFDERDEFISELGKLQSLDEDKYLENELIEIHGLTDWSKLPSQAQKKEIRLLKLQLDTVNEEDYSLVDESMLRRKKRLNNIRNNYEEERQRLERELENMMASVDRERERQSLLLRIKRRRVQSCSNGRTYNTALLMMDNASTTQNLQFHQQEQRDYHRNLAIEKLSKAKANRETLKSAKPVKSPDTIDNVGQMDKVVKSAALVDQITGPANIQAKFRLLDKFLSLVETRHCQEMDFIAERLNALLNQPKLALDLLNKTDEILVKQLETHLESYCSPGGALSVISATSTNSADQKKYFQEANKVKIHRRKLITEMLPYSVACIMKRDPNLSTESAAANYLEQLQEEQELEKGRQEEELSGAQAQFSSLYVQQWQYNQQGYSAAIKHLVKSILETMTTADRSSSNTSKQNTLSLPPLIADRESPSGDSIVSNASLPPATTKPTRRKKIISPSETEIESQLKKLNDKSESLNRRRELEKKLHSERIAQRVEEKKSSFRGAVLAVEAVQNLSKEYEEKLQLHKNRQRDAQATRLQERAISANKRRQTITE